MKENVPGLNKIIYFSDGASAQYKKKKNFLNICLHEEDFGVSAEWNFFVTSHGKGPCDGIEEALKRLATRASLEPNLREPIINTLHKLFPGQKRIETLKILQSNFSRTMIMQMKPLH